MYCLAEVRTSTHLMNYHSASTTSSNSFVESATAVYNACHIDGITSKSNQSLLARQTTIVRPVMIGSAALSEQNKKQNVSISQKNCETTREDVKSLLLQ